MRRIATGGAVAVALGLLLGAMAVLAAGESRGDEAADRRPERFKLTQIARLHSPVFATAAPGRYGRGKLFVVERPGTVRIIRHGKLLRRPFLDIRELVSRRRPEQGLLGIAFDPAYGRSGRFYAYFTDLDDSVRVAGFTRSESNPLVADPDSMKDVIAIPHPDFPSHNGGTVAFGPDGNLWLAPGDGGGRCDPSENAQSTDSLLGKLLRISPRPNGGYDVPADNPFVGLPGRDEIYSYGFRNPYRFSFDERTNTITIGDVGQSRIEEVDHETLEDARGANFGWDALEGSRPLVLRGQCDTDEDETPVPDRSEPPVFEYRHDLRDCAVTGGLIVRDRRLGSLRRRYLYADLCRAELRSFRPTGDAALDERRVGPTVSGPTSIVAGRRSRIYVTSIVGGVYRLDPVRRSRRR